MPTITTGIITRMHFKSFKLKAIRIDKHVEIFLEANQSQGRQIPPLLHIYNSKRDTT